MKKHVLPTLIIGLITTIFFARLFFPEPKLFYTPDIGRSDIANFNYPLKNFLSQSLRIGNLPFWNKNMGTGFPLFAEGQIGSLFIENLVLFSFLPTWIAFNLSYLLSFFIGALGTYFFLKKNNASSTSSLLAAIAFTFSGSLVTRLHFLNVIQTISLIPWLFFTAQLLWQKPSIKYALFFSLLLSQQIFVGYQPMTFITIFGIAVFFLTKTALQKPTKAPERLITLLLATVLAIAISAPQILPTLQLTLLSDRKFGLPLTEIFKYPYPFSNLITFILPNFFGNPKYGTYPLPNSNLGLYWENTAYIGLVPLILALAILGKKTKTVFQKSLIALTLFSLLLAVGKKTALIFLLPFPGFSFMRIPSRFLILTTFSLSALAASYLDLLIAKLKTKKIPKLILNSLLLLILTVAVTDLFIFGYNHNPIVPVATALKPPSSLAKIANKQRIYTSKKQSSIWNIPLITQGWQDPSPFIFFKNGLDANLNLLYNITQVRAYAGLLPSRLKAFQNTLNLENLKLLNASAAQTILSPEKIDTKELKQTALITSPQSTLPNYYIYQNTQTLNRFRFATNYLVSKDLNHTQQLIQDDDFSFKNTAILEKDLQQQFEPLEIADIQILKDQNQHLSLQTTTDKPSLLIIADSYYPGWFASINGKPTKIYPANINQRALIIPPGTNNIELKYIPYTFYLGALISSLTLSVIGYYLYKHSSKKSPATNRRKNKSKTNSV